MIKVSQFEYVSYIWFMCIVEDWCCDWNIVFEVLIQFGQFLFGFWKFGIFVIGLFQFGCQCLDIVVMFIGFISFVDLGVQVFIGLIQVSFEDLIDVYVGWNVQWVENDVNGFIIGQEWYVFDWVDFGNDIFVVVVIGYFVIWLKFVFYGNKDFDYFYYVWWYFIVVLKFVDFVFEMMVQVGFGVFVLFLQCFDFIYSFFVVQIDVLLLVVWGFVEGINGDFVFGKVVWFGNCCFVQ